MSAATPIVPARVAANRRNARKFTGPRTPVGKARSRANALKHGLTGAGVALPGEDAARIEAEFLRVQEDLGPITLLGMKLARRAALLSVRLHRCERPARACEEGRIRHAVAEHDRARTEHADRLLDAIEADPRTYRRALLATPEGVDRLVAGLDMLKDELTAPAPAWSPAHHKRLNALFGYRVADLPWGRPTRFSRALMDDFEPIGPAEVADVPEADHAGWDLLKLVEVVEAEVARLAAHRATLDHAALAADREAAPDRAALAADRVGEQVRRYEAATARELSRILQDIHRVEALAGAGEEPEPPTLKPAAAAASRPFRRPPINPGADATSPQP